MQIRNLPAVSIPVKDIKTQLTATPKNVRSFRLFAAVGTLTNVKIYWGGPDMDVANHKYCGYFSLGDAPDGCDSQKDEGMDEMFDLSEIYLEADVSNVNTRVICAYIEET